MAEKKANPSGVSTTVVRETVKNSSILVLLQIKFEEWQKAREGKRFSRKMARAKAAKALGITPKPKPAPKPKAAPVADPANPRKQWLVRALFLMILLLASASLLASVVVRFSRPGIEATSLPVGTPTAVTALAVVASTEATVAPDGSSVYLRVETLRLDTTYGIWRRMPGIPILLSPFGEDGELRETLRQVTEEMVTVAGVRVAVTTFEVPAGTYWVGIDEEGLPADCAVWVPRLETDEGNQISFRSQPSWVAVRLDAYPGFNVTVVKFQIICGLEFEAVPTNPPPSPTSVPPTNPPPTDSPGPTPTPEPTDPPSPTPTDSCGPDCVEPPTPVPTPTEYLPGVPTPTPVR